MKRTKKSQSRQIHHRERYILDLDEVGQRDLPWVGGKGANLGELKGQSFPVPDGFCLTTSAYAQFLDIDGLGGRIYQHLEGLGVDQLEVIRRRASQIQGWITQTPLPKAMRLALLERWRAMGSGKSYAIRSSATAEDLPTASFAGQQSTYLGMRGAEALLQGVLGCWASLFNERAIIYRLQNGFEHNAVRSAVVIQEMVEPRASGVVFTANPINGHRRQLVIEAVLGLGEALVSGRVNPDRYTVDGNRWDEIHREVAEKASRLQVVDGQGLVEVAVEDGARAASILSDDEILHLHDLARRIESHFEAPQDIEWCLNDSGFYVVQSRPITSLFPLPKPGPDSDDLRVYFSFNHVQVMTHPMPPMAVDIWRHLFPFGKAEALWKSNPLITSAAGRIYVDATPLLLQFPTYTLVPQAMALANPQAAKALIEIRDREEFARGNENPRAAARPHNLLRHLLPIFGRLLANLLWRPMHNARRRVGGQLNGILKDIKDDQALCVSGYERLKRLQVFALGEVPNRLLTTFPPRVLAGVIASRIIRALLKGRVDESHFDNLLRGLTGNVTTEMDLMVGDLADVARQYPALAEALRAQYQAGGFEGQALLDVEGGGEFMAQLNAFLDAYGMRGPSEIDISRPRYRDEPRSLVGVVLGNIEEGEIGEHRKKHAQMVADGEAAVAALLEACGSGVMGFFKRLWVKRLASVARTLLSLREHPKFFIIRLFSIVRAEVLAQAADFVARGQLKAPDDIWYLHWKELVQGIEDPGLIYWDVVAKRRRQLAHDAHLHPPPVMTSDGEIPQVKYDKADLPEGALPGTSASAGVVEGVARVLKDPTSEVLRAGEILVAPFTDPGWTPLFINAAGLVMDVGGFMTHGSVVAREYGIPAVVAVNRATALIKTGQIIRVNGDEGWVEILEEGPNPHDNAPDRRPLRAVGA